MADDASTHLGPQIDVVIEADLQQAESAVSALGTIDGSLGKLTENLSKVGAAAAKLEPILASVSQRLDNLSGKGIEYDTIQRAGKLPIIENMDFVSKDIKNIGSEVAKELRTMIETLVTEVGVMGDGFRQTLGPIITEARQVRRAASSVIQFPQEQGIDTVQGLTIQSRKEFERSEKLSVAQEDAQYKDYSALVHTIQLKQENLDKLRTAKGTKLIAELKAYEEVLDTQIDKIAIRHGLDIDQVTKSVTAGEEIQEDAIRMLIESSLGAKGRPVVDLSSTKYLNWTGSSEDETAQVKQAIAKALNSMPVYKQGMRGLRPIEKELNKLLKGNGKPEQIQAALSKFIEAYNKIAITYNNLEESITTLMSGQVIPIDDKLLSDIKDSTDVINGSLHLSLVDFKPAVIPQLPPKPQPVTLNKAQIIQQIKAKPRMYENVVPSVQKAQEIAGARKTVYVDIETAPSGQITHTSVLSGGTNEVITSREKPPTMDDWHIENIAHEAYNPSPEFAKSRGATLVQKNTYAESLLQIVKKLTIDLKGLKVATYGDSDLEIVIAEMNRLVVNNLAPEFAKELTSGASALRVVQQDRLVDVLEKVKQFFELIQPGFYGNTVKSKGLSALVPLVEKIMKGASKLVPHIPVDDNVITAGLDQLLSGPNAALELYVSKETLRKPSSEWTLSPEFSAYLTGVLESPVYEYARLVANLGKLRTDNFKDRLPIEKQLRDLEIAHSDVRTISEEGISKVLASTGVIESGFRPYSSKLSLVDTTPVLPIDVARRSNPVIEQAITRIAEGIAKPMNRGASLDTLRNSADKDMLDKLFANLLPAQGTVVTGRETSNLLDTLFGNENLQLLQGVSKLSNSPDKAKTAEFFSTLSETDRLKLAQGATTSGTIKSIIYDVLIKYTGSTDFSAVKLEDAAYMNNLNTRLATRNYSPNPDLSRVIPAQHSEAGNLYSQTKLHGAEVDDFLAFLDTAEGIFKGGEAEALAAFQVHKAANPKLFPLDLAYGGEATEVKNNALLANLPLSRVIGGKTGLVGASKDLEGGFATVFHALDTEGSKVFSIVARFDEALVDASAGIEQAVRILILDVKQRSKAGSAAEVANDPKLATQMTMYAASHGLPTGVAVDTHTNILEIALFKMAGDVDRAVLSIMQRIGKSLGKDVVSVAKEHFGDFEGTLQTALNSIAKDAGVKQGLVAKQVIDSNRLYGVNQPQIGFTPDAYSIAQNIAEQNYTKHDTFGKEQQIFSETNTARLLGTTTVQTEVVTGLPVNGVAADRVAFDAINGLLTKLRVNLEGLTSHELVNGLLGQTGKGIVPGNALGLSIAEFTQKLTTAIDTVSNLAMEDAGKARAFLAEGATHTPSLVPTASVNSVVAGIKAEAALLEEARLREAAKSGTMPNGTKPTTLPARVERDQGIHIPISDIPTSSNVITLTGGGGNKGGSGGGGGGGGGILDDEKILPPGRDAVIEARPDSAKEYRVAAGTIGVNEELYGKTLGTVQGKAAAAADEIKRLINLVASTVGTTFLDSAQKDFLAFDIKVRETSLGLEAFKRAQHTVASGDMQSKSFANSIRGMQTELSDLERMAKNGDKLLPNQAERLKSLPTIIDYTKAQKANIEDKVKVARTEVDMWKELQKPPEGMTSQQFFGNTIRKAESLADRAAAKQRIDLYTENRDALLASVGPQKTESHKLLQSEATRAEGLAGISNTEALLVQKALVTGLRAEFAALDSNVAKYGTNSTKEFVAANDKVKQQIELVKLLEKDKASLEGKFAKQSANLERTDLSDSQRRTSQTAQGRLGQALALNATETETALKTISQLLGELDSKALKARQSLAAAMRLDYSETIKKRTDSIADELTMLSEKSKAGLGTPADALKRAQLNYENAALTKGDISGSFTKLLEKEDKNRYSLNSRAQGVEHADVFAGLQEKYGMKDSGLFQSLTSDYARLLSTPKLGASAIGASTDTVEQKLKELKRIEDEIAKSKAAGKQSVTVNLKVNWNQAKQEVEIELDKLKQLIEAKFKASLDPSKQKELYVKNQLEVENALDKRKQVLESKGKAGTQTLADQAELKKVMSELAANRASGKGYAASLLTQLTPVNSPLDSIHANERLKGAGFGSYADQGNVTDAYRKLMGQTAASVIKGDKSGPQSQLEKLFTDITQATTNRDFLDKQLEQYKGKDLSLLPPNELGNHASLVAQRRSEQDKATKLQQQLPAAIESAEAISMSPASILQKHAEINAALRVGLNLKKEWIEAEIAAGFKTDENLAKLREVNKLLTSLNDLPLSRKEQYTQTRDTRLQELTDKHGSIKDDMSEGVLTLEKYKQLQQIKADIARTSGASDSVAAAYAMQPKVESPLKSFNANQNLASLGFGAQATVQNPIEVFKRLGAQLATATAESGPSYNLRVDDLMTKIAESNARKSHAQAITKPYEAMTSGDLATLAPEEAGHLGRAKKTIKDEIATATRLIGELHTAINNAQTHELSDPQVTKRLAEAITLLKEGLNIEKQWLDAEVKLGLASGEHVKRLQEVNLQTARLSGNAADIKKYSEKEVSNTRSPLGENTSLTFAANVAEKAKLQEVGIHFDTEKSSVAKKALEGLITDFSKFDALSKGTTPIGLEKTFLALQRNYDLTKLYDTELVKINGILALDSTNTKATADKAIYLTLLQEQVRIQENLVKTAKDELKVQQEVDRSAQALAAKAVKKATSTLSSNVDSEGKIRAEISAGVDLEGNVKRLHALEVENNKLREAAKKPFVSSGTAEDLAKLHNVQLDGGRRGAAGFVEQIANMGTWWAEWSLGQNVMQAIPNALQGGITFAKEFEAQMKNVELITQANKVQFEQLVGTISQLSTNRIFSPKELAEGLIILGQAGFNAVESMKLLPSVTDLATATLASLKVAADITTTAIEAFNIPIANAGELANTLAAITIESKLEINSLGTTFNYIAESAAGAGLSIEQIGTAMGIMSNAGVRASTIGTSLRSVLGTLMAPTPKFSAELGKVGMSVEDVNPRYRELGTILTDLKDKGFDVQSAFQGLDKRIAGAITSLITNAGEYQGFLGKISGTDRASIMAEGQMDTFDAQSKRLKHGLQLMGGEMFGPSLLPMKVATDVLATMVEVLNQMLSLIPVNVRAILGMGTAMGLASAAVMTLVSGFKLLLATSAINPATNAAYTTFQTLKALVSDKDVFKPARLAVAAVPAVLDPITRSVVTPAIAGSAASASGALAGTTGVKKQFLELIAMFISPQAILLALGAAAAAAAAYVTVRNMSGASHVDEIRHTADVTETYASQLTDLEQVLNRTNSTTVLYSESMRKLRTEYGLMSKEQLAVVAASARVTATESRVEAYKASGTQRVGSFNDFWTFKDESKKSNIKNTKDDWISALKADNKYYSADPADIKKELDSLNKDKTVSGNEAAYQVLLQIEEDRNKPDASRNNLAEARRAALTAREKVTQMSNLDELQQAYVNSYSAIDNNQELRWYDKPAKFKELQESKSAEVKSARPEMYKYLKNLGASESGGTLKYTYDHFVNSAANPVNFANPMYWMAPERYTHTVLQETPAQLLTQYEAIKSGKMSVGSKTANSARALFGGGGQVLTDVEIAEMDKIAAAEKVALDDAKYKEGMAGSQYLKAKGEQTGIVYSGAQLAILEELKVSQKKRLGLIEKVENEKNEGLKAVWEEDLANTESTMKRLAKTASVLLIEKLPGFENAKGIPKGVLQSLDQFVPYINAGTTVARTADDELRNTQIQQYNTQQLKGINPADLPETGKKLEAVKRKYDELIASSGLAKFDPKKTGEEWSKQHEVYFAIQARMDLEMQETVEGVITAGWAKIEPKLAKVKAVLQDMLKMKQFNIELGFSTSMNEVNIQAAQATLDYLGQYKPATVETINRGGMDVTSHTGNYLRMAQGYDWTSEEAKNSTLDSFQRGMFTTDTKSGLDTLKNPTVPGTGRFVAAQLQTTRVANGPDYSTFYNPEDISYDWKNAGDFQPYFQRGGVDQSKEFRISQQKEFGTIKAELAKSEELAKEKMRTAVTGYGSELGMYAKVGTKAAPAEYKATLEEVFGITKPTETSTAKPGTLDGFIAATKSATSPLEILGNLKGMEEQVLLDRDKAKNITKITQMALDKAKADLAAEGGPTDTPSGYAGVQLTPSHVQPGIIPSLLPSHVQPLASAEAPKVVLSTAESTVNSLTAAVENAQKKELEINSVLMDKMVAARKTAYTAIAEAQKESLNGIYAALQKELAMQIATAKKIEESRAYRGQVKIEAQTVMEGFAKATGDWKEPTGQEKINRVAGLQSEMEDAFQAGRIEEGKKAYAKLKETAVKYRDDGTMNTDDKRRLGDTFAQSAESVDYYVKKDERKLQEESDARGKQLQPLIKKKLEEAKSVLDITQEQVGKMDSSQLTKHTQNLEKYKALEQMSSMTPEQIGKMGSDERMKAVFDKERLDIEGFSNAADKFSKAVDLLLARAQETGAVVKDPAKAAESSTSTSKQEYVFSLNDDVKSVLSIAQKNNAKNESDPPLRQSDLTGLSGR